MTPISSRTALVALLVWLAIAIAIGAAGVPARLRPPAPQMLIALLSLALIGLGLWVGPVRQWFLQVDERAVVALHLTRFVGIYFLVLYSRGQLPYDFAVPGGIGDIAVAFFALLLIALSRSTNPVGWWIYFAWNLVGLIDILFVVSTAARLALAQPESMAALLRLPLSLLPTWLVPLIIASHVLFALRLLRARKNLLQPGAR